MILGVCCPASVANCLYMNDHWMVFFQSGSKILIPCRGLAAMAPKRENFEHALVKIYWAD